MAERSNGEFLRAAGTLVMEHKGGWRIPVLWTNGIYAGSCGANAGKPFRFSRSLWRGGRSSSQSAMIHVLGRVHGNFSPVLWGAGGALTAPVDLFWQRARPETVCRPSATITRIAMRKPGWGSSTVRLLQEDLADLCPVVEHHVPESTTSLFFRSDAGRQPMPRSLTIDLGSSPSGHHSSGL